MCEICRENPCNYRCPNYVPYPSNYCCSVCNEPIYYGEKYIENNKKEYAHWDCVCYGTDLVEFLGYEIDTM